MHGSLRLLSANSHSERESILRSEILDQKEKIFLLQQEIKTLKKFISRLQQNQIPQEFSDLYEPEEDI